MGACLRSWLHSDHLDERLAAGESPARSLELSLRAQHLVQRYIRQGLADGLDGVLRCAEAGGRPPDEAHLPVDADMVLSARDPLERLAERLRAHGQVDPRGVALARLLLVSDRSPLYGGSPPRGVEDWAEEAFEALGDPIVLGVY